MVEPYVAAHAAGPDAESLRRVQPRREVRPSRRPRPPARLRRHRDGAPRPGERRGWAGDRLRRGADRLKDQSYVLSTLSARELARVLMPVGETDQDRSCASSPGGFGLRTAAKPDSQDVCFIASRSPGLGRSGLPGGEDPPPRRPRRRRGDGRRAGGARRRSSSSRSASAVVSASPCGDRRYAVRVDVASATVFAGSREDLLGGRRRIRRAHLVRRAGADGFAGRSPRRAPTARRPSRRRHLRRGSSSTGPRGGSLPVRSSRATSATRSSARASPDDGRRRRRRAARRGTGE